MERVQLCGLIVILFSGLVHSWGENSYRGGTISYRTRSYGYTKTVEFSYRLAFDSSYVSCDAGIGNRTVWTSISPLPWSVTRFSNNGSYLDSVHGNQILCNKFSSEEGWSEGSNVFTFQGRYNDFLWIAITYNYAHWIRNVSKVDGYGSMLLSATVGNTSANGGSNNSSPVSSLPLTVYVDQGIPSVIKIPVEDPDGDIVRCRYARYLECSLGMCTYFPHGVLDEETCTLRYNGSGSAGQLFPIILKLEDFPPGNATRFDSSNRLGSVDLQFVVHIIKNTIVRIQGGGSSGRLQVLHNGVWGSVCDDGWTMTHTHVVCRQLGFDGALSYYNSGGGTGPIWLDEVRCSGNETAIEQCRHNGWGSHDCSHSEDIGVNCYRDECNNYIVLSESNREQGYQGIKDKCDRRPIAPGWYRFMGDAGTTMATTCVPVRHCGTAAPGWMMGSHPTQVEGVVTRTACFHWNGSCCFRSISIRVKNCGGFYVYQLNRPEDCDLRYCGKKSACANSPCQNGATCVVTEYGYNCTCPYGYTGRYCEVARETNCWHTAVSIHYTVGPSNVTVTQSDANSVMDEVLQQGKRQLSQSCPGLKLKLLKATIETPSNRYVITGSFGIMYDGMNSNQEQTAALCLKNSVIFSDIILRPDYYTSPLRGSYFADRASSTNYQDRTCCTDGLAPLNGKCDLYLQTNVTCDESYMQIDLEDKYFSDIDWRNLHLKDSSCRATETPDTSRLRTPLNRCGTTYTETEKTITFWNEVKTDERYQPAGNGSSISRNRHLNLRFFCSYERSRFVSTSFSPSKKTVVASEGSYGNFTFTMDLYRYPNYSTPYSPFDYPVVVYPNQPLWVQYEVKNTNADLVVFAENCRATPSNDPNATPQHVFLQKGCVRDPTMSYWYNPYSNVQQFSIRSFRFVYSNTFLVYLHCELLVCHRNTTNSRCAQGCISGSRRRRETDDMDGSNLYDLSAGPLKGGEINAKGDNQEGSSTSKQLIGGLGAFGGVFFVITILLSVIVYRNRRRGQDNKATSIALDVTVNSYEQDNVDSDEKDCIGSEL